MSETTQQMQAGVPVIIVDDDEPLRRALLRLLAAHGYATQGFASAEQFLASEPAAIGCLVLDIDLGGMSGMALYRRLHERGNPPPAVFISGSDDPQHGPAASALGATALLKKPCDSAELIAAIRMACR